jgi:hypothetical protein
MSAPVPGVVIPGELWAGGLVPKTSEMTEF